MQVPIKRSIFSPVETAYASAAGAPAVAHGWCPLSKIIGVSGHRKQGAGVAWGKCPAEFINARDASVSCMMEDDVGGLTVSVKTDATNNLYGYKNGNPQRANVLASGRDPALQGAENVADCGKQCRSYGSYSSCPGCGPSGYVYWGVGGPCGCANQGGAIQTMNMTQGDAGGPPPTFHSYPRGSIKGRLATGHQPGTDTKGLYGPGVQGQYGAPWPRAGREARCEHAGHDWAPSMCGPCNGTAAWKQNSRSIGSIYDCGSFKYPRGDAAPGCGGGGCCGGCSGAGCIGCKA